MAEESDRAQSEEYERLTNEVHELRELLEKLRLQQYVQALLSPRHIMFISFLSGIFSGLGAVLGATVVLAFLLYILGKLQVIPFIGHFVYEILKIVQQHQHP